jgi:hypothetical protein
MTLLEPIIKRKEVIQWVIKINPSSVPIAEIPSPSVQKSRNSSLPEAIPMSQNVA